MKGKKQNVIKMRKSVLITLLFILFFSQISFFVIAQNISLATITVEAGNFTRINTPVSLPLDDISLNVDNELFLEEILKERSVEVPCQIEQGVSPRLWWILSGKTKPGEKRIFRLSEGKTIEGTPVKVRKGSDALQIFVNNQKVLQYFHVPVSPPEGVDSIFARSAFIHPLWSPSGAILTRIQPPDHYHHYGIWNPWTKTNFEGREVDFWNLGKGQGTVRFKGFVSLINGQVYGGFKAIHEHVDFTSPEGEKNAMNEEWDIRVWNLGGDYGFWMWDFTSKLNCASSSPIILEQYRYAGFGFRATEYWTNKNSGILTSEGKTRKDGDATRARWSNIYGATETGTSGIVFMSHPYNREHPEPMRIWPEDSNGGRGDMFFQFCPIRERSWELKPGKDYILRYRMYVYDGTVTPETAERLWQDFANPPKVRVDKIME